MPAKSPRRDATGWYACAIAIRRAVVIASRVSGEAIQGGLRKRLWIASAHSPSKTGVNALMRLAMTGDVQCLPPALLQSLHAAGRDVAVDLSLRADEDD